MEKVAMTILLVFAGYIGFNILMAFSSIIAILYAVLLITSAAFAASKAYKP